MSSITGNFKLVKGDYVAINNNISSFEGAEGFFFLTDDFDDNMHIIVNIHTMH